MSIRHRGTFVCLVLSALLLVTPALGANSAPTFVATAPAGPYGTTYPELAARWWQWALQTPAPVNPLVDTTGAHCRSAQQGKVWFLAGSLGPAPVSRTCQVPAGKALFFPIISEFYGAFLSDPPDQRTERYIRAQVACALQVKRLALSLDGRAADTVRLHDVRSVIFDVQLPKDNILGATKKDIPKLRLSPSAAAGYFALLSPLPPGRHTLRWRAANNCGSGGASQDVSYELVISPR